MGSLGTKTVTESRLCWTRKNRIMVRAGRGTAPARHDADDPDVRNTTFRGVMRRTGTGGSRTQYSEGLSRDRPDYEGQQTNITDPRYRRR